MLQIGCRDEEHKHPDMPIYITKMRDGGKEPFSLTKAFDRMRIYDGAPAGVYDGLDDFEDALTKDSTKPLPDLEILEDDEVTPSNSPVLDFGDSEDADISDDDGDFEADF